MRRTLGALLGEAFLLPKWDKCGKGLHQPLELSSRFRIWCLVLWQLSCSHEGRHHCWNHEGRHLRMSELKEQNIDDMVELLCKSWNCPLPNFLLSGIIKVQMSLSHCELENFVAWHLKSSELIIPYIQEAVHVSHHQFKSWNVFRMQLKSSFSAELLN